ncbi:3'-5' exonuclease family protein [Bifidobacterium vansinderenii]|uniref:Uncharacterized protein n=1 Tax=Bifidobacterium vansinderenii TaxID=1984871 RepID=A0A229W0Q2_9BIFI|nr:hypothetical protein [Bifidobacterium vansinderenii]OXN01454.1 hypothetical protein Tam10B_0457 [Bifidobacterium vansinderenii]
MNETDKPVRLLWVDVETTGLDPVRDHLLEASVRVTDLSGVELSRHHVLARPEHWETVLKTMDAGWRHTHTVNGLIQAVDAVAPHLGDIRFAGLGLTAFIAAQAGEAVLRPAGWNPQFDMRWLTRTAPDALGLLDYHWMDVQSAFALLEHLSPDTAKRILDQTPQTDHRSDQCLDREISVYRLLRQAMLIGPLGFHEVTPCS